MRVLAANFLSPILAASLAILAGLSAASLFAQTTLTGTANGPGGSDDNWNNAANWTSGIPSGVQSAIISPGLFAQIDDSSGSATGFSGGLTLGTGSRLQVGWTTVYATNINALGTGTITLNSGAEIISRAGLGTYTFNQPFVLPGGSATLWGGISTANHHTTKTLAGGISGVGELNYNGVNNTTLILNTNNAAWSGGFQTSDPQNQGHRVRAQATGAFGTSDVTINNNATLYFQAANAISNGAALFLNASKSSRTEDAAFDKIDLTAAANQTVSELWIDGIAQNSGTYTNAATWLSGSGTLTVLAGPNNLAADTRAPLPNPMAFDTVPRGLTTTSIEMAAVLATDLNSVEYQFRRDGSVLSAWQAALSFVDIGLVPAQLYNYEVRARDSLGNTGNWSSIFASTPIVENIMTTNAAGGANSWNSASNWTGGVPSGSDTAIIGMGVAASVNAAPPAYNGNLELRANSSLTILSDTGIAVIPGASGKVTMGNGSLILLRTSNTASGAVSFPELELLGNAIIQGGQSTSGHHTTRSFNGEISGPGQLTLAGVNNNTFVFNSASPLWSGGVQTSDPQNQRHQVVAAANGVFGTGNVAINNNASLQINAGLTDTIHDDATLFVNGVRSTTYAAKLALNSSETVGGFSLNNVLLPAGGYHSGSGLVDSGSVNLISGTGILTVNGAPLYWDTNGAVSGTNVASAGNWTDASWSLDSDGDTATTHPWTAGYDAVFSAGTNGTGTQTISIAGMQAVKNLVVEEGSVVFNDGGAGVLNLSGNASIQSGATAAINVTTQGVDFNVLSGGTLKGTGTINGNVNLFSGGLHAVGNSIGMQIVMNETWNGGGVVEIEFDDFFGVAGTNWDLLTVTNALTISATPGDPLILKLVSLDTMNDNFDATVGFNDLMIAGINTLGGFDADAFTFDTSMFGHDLMGGMFNVSTDGNNLFLNFQAAAAVPEPAAVAVWSVIGLCLAGVGARRFRRKEIGR